MGIQITPQEMDLLQMLPQSYLEEENDAHKIVANDIGFLVVETIIFALYLTSRYMHNGARGIETRFLLPVAYLCNLGLVIGGLRRILLRAPLARAKLIQAIVAVEYGGAGYYIYALLLRDPNIVTTYLKIQTATEVFYLVAITCSKLVILVLYLRVFTNRWIRHLTWATGALIVANLIAGLLSSFLICRPYAFKWDQSIDGTCGDIMATFRWVSLPNIMTDVAILLLPLSTLLHLQIGRAQKFILLLTFLIGGLGIVAAIMRIITFFEIDMTKDPTFLCTKTAITTDAESGAYFICACFPGLRTLFSRAQKRMKSTKFASTSKWTTKRSSSSTEDKHCMSRPSTSEAPYTKTLQFSSVSTVNP